ncbi:MAG: dockerin type I repeat-containing protein, partial [Oscillospiraceae bacterium]|nr:dockerin type I repeat-containing protein [Oscillospiraceae bacterium]
EYEVHNSYCEYLGHGTDILGEDFVKVIRHEWIKDFDEYTSEDFSNMTFIQGDATEDEDVNIIDVIAVNKNILGKEKMSAYAQYVSDVNQNGTVDSGDSLEILKYVVGLNETL